MASEVLNAISKDEAEYFWRLSREKYELDTQSRLAYAEQQGIQKGEQRIINLLKSGKSPEEIINNLTQ